MNTEELLDRLELLYPDNNLIVDLRKSILSDDRFALFRLIKHLSDTPLVEALRKIDRIEEFDNDAFSRGQIKSKKWIIKELEKLNVELGTVFLCAGWYATLAAMLFESNCKIEKIRSFDIDENCLTIANTVNKKYILEDWKFKATTYDIHKMTYPLVYDTLRADHSVVTLTDNPDTIINTSCEHIRNFKDWYDKIPDGKLLVMQNNNYRDIEDHVNCAESLEDFAKQTPMTQVLYEGELQLIDYTRYMRIGYK
jgi:hypothetical protein